MGSLYFTVFFGISFFFPLSHAPFTTLDIFLFRVKLGEVIPAGSLQSRGKGEKGVGARWNLERKRTLPSLGVKGGRAWRKEVLMDVMSALY